MVDADLISRAVGGDPAAFQLLVEQHRSMVYRVAYQFAGNHYDAEDIAQDVFIKVYRSLPRFRQDAQFTSWIYRIAMNACIDHRPGPETSAYAGELGEVLEAAIGRLPHGQRLVFVMRHYEGLKLGEIAAALGLAEGTVKRQLHAAVHRLRAALSAANVTVGGRR